MKWELIFPLGFRKPVDFRNENISDDLYQSDFSTAVGLGARFLKVKREMSEEEVKETFDREEK